MSGLSLGHADVAGLRELIALAASENGPALPWPFLYRLQDLIGCDAVAFNGLDSTAGYGYLSQGIGEKEFIDTSSDQYDAADEPFWRHYWTSWCSYPERSGDHTSVTMSADFCSDRQWHDSAMYIDYASAWGRNEHELMMPLPDGAGRSLRLLCFRGPGVDFGERERFLLTLLRPHIAEAYKVALRRRRHSGAALLTTRQREILELVKVGYTNEQIARRLYLSEGTVRTHLGNIFTRLEVSSRTAAVTHAAHTSD